MIEVKKLKEHVLSIKVEGGGSELAADVSNIVQSIYANLPKKEAKVFKDLTVSMIECAFESDRKKQKEMMIKKATEMTIRDYRKHEKKSDPKIKDDVLSGIIESAIAEIMDAVDEDED